MTAPAFMDRRQGDRRHNCAHCPALNQHHSRRAMMIGPLIVLTTLAVTYTVGFISGQSRITERPRFSSISPTVQLLPQYGPPIPAHVGTVER